MSQEEINYLQLKMAGPGKKNIWIIVVIVLIIAMSGEFANMAKQVSFLDALLSFAILTLLVSGIVY